MFFKPKTQKIYDQINEYVVWKSQNFSGAFDDKRYLTMFAKATNIKDILEVEEDDIKAFKDEVLVQFNTAFCFDRSMVSVRGFIRYYKTQTTKRMAESLRLAKI